MHACVCATLDKMSWRKYIESKFSQPILSDISGAGRIGRNPINMGAGESCDNACVRVCDPFQADLFLLH